MAIGTGTVKFSEIRTEFAFSGAVKFSELYRGGTKVRGNAGNNNSVNLAAGVPTSGALAVSDFKSQARGFRYTYTSGATNQNASNLFGDDYGVDYPKEIIINAGVELGSTSTSNEALQINSGGAGDITITNNGTLSGAGGSGASSANGNGSNGGDAFEADITCTLVNNGTIRGGGGGGGGGGSGSRVHIPCYGRQGGNENSPPSITTMRALCTNAGADFSTSYRTCCGGTCGPSSCNGYQAVSGCPECNGGGTNGANGYPGPVSCQGDASIASIICNKYSIGTAGGRGQGYNQTSTNASGSSSGAGDGGDGGSYGSSGGNGANGNGGGSQNSSGGNGGSSGKAIRGTSFATVTNNGTLSGGTAS